MLRWPLGNRLSRRNCNSGLSAISRWRSLTFWPTYLPRQGGATCGAATPEGQLKPHLANFPATRRKSRSVALAASGEGRSMPTSPIAKHKGACDRMRKPLRFLTSSGLGLSSVERSPFNRLPRLLCPACAARSLIARPSPSRPRPLSTRLSLPTSHRHGPGGKETGGEETGGKGAEEIDRGEKGKKGQRSTSVHTASQPPWLFPPLAVHGTNPAM